MRMSLIRGILTGGIRRPSYKKKAEANGQAMDIQLDGTGFSEGGNTYFAFNLNNGSFDGDSLIIGGKTFEVVEQDGMTYVKNLKP